MQNKNGLRRNVHETVLHLQLFQNLLVFVRRNAHIPDNLTQQWADDHLRAVIGDDDDLPARIAKNRVTPLLSYSMESFASATLASVPNGMSRRRLI